MRFRAVLTVARRDPAKALLLASGLGWAATALLLGGEQTSHAAAHLVHGRHSGAAVLPPVQAPLHFTALWLAMVLAMAPPLMLREIGVVWRRSLRRLRSVTMTAFVAGYLAIWMPAGIVLATVSGWLSASGAGAGLALLLVVAWHCSPAHQRCINACHRTPVLRAFGAGAGWDGLRYGLSTGCYCAGACGLLMLPVLLIERQHLAAMAVASLVATLERHVPPRRPRWRLPLLRARSQEWPEMAGPSYTS